MAMMIKNKISIVIGMVGILYSECQIGTRFAILFVLFFSQKLFALLRSCHTLLTVEGNGLYQQRFMGCPKQHIAVRADLHNWTIFVMMMQLSNVRALKGEQLYEDDPWWTLASGIFYSQIHKALSRIQGSSCFCWITPLSIWPNTSPKNGTE